MRDAESFNPKSHIMKHWVNEHPDRLEMPPFTFTTTCQFKDCLSRRQIGEALKINYSKDELLNSKSEYIKNCLTRLTIEESSWEKNERERLEDREEVKEQEAIVRLREKVETHLFARDIMMNIFDDATEAKKTTRTTTREHEELLMPVTRLALHTIHSLKKWFSCPALDTGYSLGFDSVGNSNLIRVHFTTTQYS